MITCRTILATTALALGSGSVALGVLLIGIRLFLATCR
jgi:hypothetical protein